MSARSLAEKAYMRSGGRAAVQDWLPPEMVLCQASQGQPGPDPAHAPQPPRDRLGRGDTHAHTGLRRSCQRASHHSRGQRALPFAANRCCPFCLSFIMWADHGMPCHLAWSHTAAARELLPMPAQGDSDVQACLALRCTVHGCSLINLQRSCHWSLGCRCSILCLQSAHWNSFAAAGLR